jgi:hypothetical protein
MHQVAGRGGCDHAEGRGQAHRHHILSDHFSEAHTSIEAVGDYVSDGIVGDYGQAGRQPGDPAKAAAMMIEVVGDPNPPRHLLLGEDAYDAWDRTVKSRIADIDRFRERGLETSFEGAEIRTIG